MSRILDLFLEAAVDFAICTWLTLDSTSEASTFLLPFSLISKKVA